MKLTRYIVFILTMAWAMNDVGIINHLMIDLTPAIELSSAEETEEQIEDETEKYLHLSPEFELGTSYTNFSGFLTLYHAPALLGLEVPPEHTC